MRKRDDFLDRLVRSYPRDEVAWQGVGRIARELIANPGIPGRRLVARWLAQVIERADPMVGKPLFQHVAGLRRLK
ncbi:MAG TPA: hypothetical protein ENI87_07670 [bacterium]|nr:hypothetical protein [bacterium]